MYDVEGEMVDDGNDGCADEDDGEDAVVLVSEEDVALDISELFEKVEGRRAKLPGPVDGFEVTSLRVVPFLLDETVVATLDLRRFV